MRLLTLITLALMMAGLVVVATHADSLDGNTQHALDLVVNIMRTILGVVVDFIGQVLDQFVRAAKSFFAK